jgi:GR25 family glycosyltransferase involved in LPS biosynthesis
MHKVYGPLLINLDRRPDRLLDVTNEFERINLKFIRISASTGYGNGALGCLESHCICLEDFLKTDEACLMVCEDDTVFNCTREELDTYIEEFISDDHAEIACLGYNAISDGSYSTSLFTRSRNIQTTVSYIIKRDLAEKLLILWRNLYRLIVSNEHTTDPDNWYSKEFNAIPNIGIVWDIYTADQSWKILQQAHIFVIPNKRLVVQKASFSDIEHKFVDYGI